MSPVKTVDEYLANAPAEMRPTLEGLRQIIQAAAPEADEVLSYSIPTYRHHGALVAFGAAKNHCGLYVMSEPAMTAHAAEIAPYSTAKTTIRFPIDAPLPAELITKIVRNRVEENEAVR